MFKVVTKVLMSFYSFLITYGFLQKLFQNIDVDSKVN